MKKLLLGVGAVVGVAALGAVGAASMQPDTIQISRTVTAQATPADVMPHLTDFTKFIEWSPWSRRDPDAKNAFSEPPSGMEAWYTWEGNDDVGSGKMTLTSMSGTAVVHHLEFFEPWASEADAPFTVTATGDHAVEITWGFVQDANLGAKVAGLFMDMEAMLGPDYEAGLATLKETVEADAKRRVAAAEAEAAAEQADAEAAAAEPAAEAQAGGRSAGWRRQARRLSAGWRVPPHQAQVRWATERARTASITPSRHASRWAYRSARAGSSQHRRDAGPSRWRACG